MQEEKITGVVLDIPTVIREAKESKWISVSEMMPRIGDLVAVIIPSLRSPIVQIWGGPIVYFKRSGKEPRGEAVLYWTPLPDPPKHP